MDTQLDAYDVYELANNDSIWATEPAVAKGIAVGAATSITVALGAFGLISEEQRTAVIAAVGDVAFGVFIVAPIAIGLVQGLWTRVSVWSGRTAARVALVNAKRTTPTLDV